jgi:ADP-dependent NAD(P)H-hydrate dehydratase / NAD(P)H-hydrate epimerase
VKPLVTPQEAVDLDRATQARGIGADALMERAGRAVARASVDLLGGVYGRRAVVVCGKGNNGGDGLVAARHLARWGIAVAVHPIERPDDLREPSSTNLRRLRTETDARIRTFSTRGLEREVARADVVVDAIFGTGFRGMPEDEWAEAIETVNGGDAPVVAVDIPSGVNGLTGSADGAAVRADLTVTFGAAKTGVVLLPGADLAGAVRVVDIGFPDDLVPATTGLTEPDDVAAVLPVRALDGHKKASGTLVIVAGSPGITGAVALMARAAMRAGAGYVFVAVPISILPVVEGKLTETVFLSLPETADGTVAHDALDVVMRALSGAHALAIGPGLTTNDETRSVVRALVRESPVPLVVDADGLNAFAGDAGGLADRKAEAVLTPHLGEYARLVDAGADDRIAAARTLSARARAVALLKGSRTVVADPSGAVRVNPTGSPVLATAGTGDVLTGVIGGLLARGLEPFDAAWAGAYLHGVAGILAGRRFGEGTVAGDLPDLFPGAIERVSGA